MLRKFQSTLPIQGETISGICHTKIILSFQSTLPIQGETLPEIEFHSTTLFQSTLPIQGETGKACNYTGRRKISIHSPYTGRDCGKVFIYRRIRHISIHSPYTGRDVHCEAVLVREVNFNPLSLYRERLTAESSCCIIYNISIHSPYTGRDCPRNISSINT